MRWLLRNFLLIVFGLGFVSCFPIDKNETRVEVNKNAPSIVVTRSYVVTRSKRPTISILPDPDLSNRELVLLITTPIVAFFFIFSIVYIAFKVIRRKLNTQSQEPRTLHISSSRNHLYTTGDNAIQMEKF
ncbi:unnamed protein product [Brachionus calyciflorus]|uniref:Uncharacterized protein n=1 Tax=Brachionus calyciflorus TaxID=104777 RepID=A0A814LTQ8_9BILA|nr:unnamed protein product [Brachionus calyciflorus]